MEVAAKDTPCGACGGPARCVRARLRTLGKLQVLRYRAREARGHRSPHIGFHNGGPGLKAGETPFIPQGRPALLDNRNSKNEIRNAKLGAENSKNPILGKVKKGRFPA